MIAFGMFDWIYVLPYFSFTISYMLVGRINIMDMVMGLRRAIRRASKFRP
jgi:hypothetical protein